MEHPGSKDTTDESVADIGTDKPESSAGSSNSETSNTATNTRPSAIERQIAAAQKFNAGSRTIQRTAGREIGRRKTYFYADRRRSYLVSLVSLLVFFLLVVSGAVLVFMDFGSPQQNPVSAVLPAAKQVIASYNASPASAPHTSVSEETPEVEAQGAIPVPIAEISVRDRPGLLEQLVQVYRSQLANDSNNSAALAALNRLREREQSLSDLEAIPAAENDLASASSFEVVSRLFPELIDDPRYKRLIARMDHAHREAKAEARAEPEHAIPLTTITSPPKTSSQSSAAAEKFAKKRTENIFPPKPTIRVVSMTPGSMVGQRFVPSSGGNVFMVEISYRNFENVEDPSELALVARLGIPGEPAVLAEVPVDVFGDRGTKSFLMDALISGNTGEKYLLNFVLNGKFLASATVRLSTPRQ